MDYFGQEAFQPKGLLALNVKETNIKRSKRLRKVSKLFRIVGVSAFCSICILIKAGTERAGLLSPPALAYTVRGTISSREYRAGSDTVNRHCSYIFSVKAQIPHYVIHTRKVMGELENEITSQYVLSDGRDVFHIKEFDVPLGGGILIVRGMFPFHAAPPAQMVWFAFVSQPYLAALSHTDGIPFRDVLGLFPAQDARFRWTLSTNSPHLPVSLEVSAPGFYYEPQPQSPPRKVLYRNAYRNGHPVLSYVCYSLTNINGYCFPEHFEVRRYGPKTNPTQANDVNLLIAQEYRVTMISLGESPGDWTPDINRSYLVSDYRFKDITGEIPVLYTNTNTYYRATNDPVVLACLPAAAKEWQNLQRHTAGDATQRLPNGALATVAVIFIAILLPLGVLLRRFRRGIIKKVEQPNPSSEKP